MYVFYAVTEYCGIAISHRFEAESSQDAINQFERLDEQELLERAECHAAEDLGGSIRDDMNRDQFARALATAGCWELLELSGVGRRTVAYAKSVPARPYRCCWTLWRAPFGTVPKTETKQESTN